MSELIGIIWRHLDSDEGPVICDEDGEQLSSSALLEVAQSVAEAIVAAGWPRQAQ